MDRQEIFDIVWDHLVTKKSPKSVSRGKSNIKGNDTFCMYRGPNGTKCAVGALVTDEECDGWGNMAVRDVRLPQRLEEHYDFLEEMQFCHDESDSIQDRIESMRKVATTYSLRVPGDA